MGRMPYLMLAGWLGLGLMTTSAWGCAPRPATHEGVAAQPAGAPSTPVPRPGEGPGAPPDPDPAPAVGASPTPSATPPPAASAPIPASPVAQAILTAARALVAQRPDEALAALAAAPPSPEATPELAPHHTLLTAEAHLARGDRPRAAELAARVSEPTLVVEATRLRARALDDPRAAAQLLEALPPAPGPLGEALAQHRRARDEAGVRRTLDRLLVEFPTSPEALTETPTVATAAWVQALGPRALVRAESLLDAHANERARDEARLLLAAKDPPPTADTACRARFVEGKALRKLRQYKGALEALGHAVRACARDEKRQRSAQLLEIQVRAIRGEPKTLRARTEALLAADAIHRFGDDALLLLAQVEEREGDVAAAKQTYQRVLDSFPTGDQAGAAAWGLAFEAIRREAWTEAEPHLRAAIAATWPEAVDRARARYWLARAHQATKRESCALYHEAAMADGLGFFTWLTLSRLDQDDAPCAQRLRDALLALDTTPTPELAARVTAERPSVVGTLAHTRALALARAVPESARDPGAQRLRTWARDALRTLVVPREDRVALALAFDELGAHKDAQDLLRAPDTGVLDRPPSATTRRAWAAAYSRAFAEEVRAAAEPERLDPLLLTALSREESTFDPEIVSWAGAVGLAQLMPGTAIIAHQAVFKKKLDFQRLTEPALNLRLGARVLDDGLDDFGGLVPLALGAYNGGPGLVQKALPRSATAFDLWSETVAVRETRRYIQRVVGTWGIYRFLYAAPTDRFVTLPRTIAASY